MREKPADHLVPWIVVPVLALGTLLFPLFIVLVPGRSGEWGARAFIHIGLFGTATVAALAGGFFRLAVMARRQRLKKWDVCLLAVALVVSALLAAILTSGVDPFEIFAVGTLVMAGLSLPALVVAAFAGKGTDAVGVLVPIYLFGVAGIYVLLGLFFTAGYDGGFS